ncbi:MAG TPA: universal stress protein [Candidatus Dormibacteraeota bacterium]|jgi:nucleotide-binding universal stress UspA family protein|nr:universal stress protein [Candidatus Dormibacteraeota bacterium]
MKQILVALARPHEALRLAQGVTLVAEPGSRVDVVHVLEAHSAETSLQARTLLSEAVEQLQARGFSAEGHLVPFSSDGAAPELARQVRQRRPDLIVMGSRGLSHLSAVLHGSVSRAILADTDTPALVVPDTAHLPHRPLRRLALAIGHDEDLEPTLHQLPQLPRPETVLVLHALRRVALHTGPSPYLEIPETSHQLTVTALRRLRRQGLQAESRELAGGDLPLAIARAAEDWGADLILVGSRRLADLQALLFGSVSHALIRRSHLPVLIAARLRPQPAPE